MKKDSNPLLIDIQYAYFVIIVLEFVSSSIRQNF